MSSTSKDNKSPRLATAVESVFVDVLYSPNRATPFSTSTLTVSVNTVNVRLQSTSNSGTVSTATFLQVLSTTGTIASSSAKTSSVILDKVSESQNASSTIIGLAIGLPLGVFCLGFCFIAFYLWHRKRHSRLYPPTPYYPKSGAPAPRPQSKIWNRLFNQEPSHHYYHKKYESSSFASNQDSGATIRYKISSINTESNPIPQHIQTPQKVAFPINKSFSSNQIDTFLYTKPPHIQSIRSALPTASPSSDMPYAKPTIPPDNGTWTYESPLSRWFLTKSTYFQDQVKQPLKSSTVKLKQLNILSRVSKNRVQSFLPDENSPILSARPPIFQDSYVKSQLDPLVFRSSSLKHSANRKESSVTIRETRFMNSEQISNFNPYSRSTTSQSVIKPQFIEKSKIDAIALLRPPQRVPSKNSDSRERNIGEKKSKHITEKLKEHLDLIDSLKPLPLTPKSKQASETAASITDWSQLEMSVLNSGTAETELNQLYVVVRDYTPNLTDEICIRRDDCVRLLAKHTDGWCLVEKCKLTGSPLGTSDDPRHCEIDGEYYLNDYRGIVPGACIKELETDA
ncbi:LANO_0G01376g1_1 [Lachancea nothofagi CBS 11611]|uniref:LANO_0G01376g1_1 n=1 Tax=Lachancea nothofagi CBS 11611 TaxID=1266666 RepID=A0A1G4KEM7_9SACH|nr:LANO_0G01376g1_1 [Lachancea nothofagi CBS 11611]